MAVKVKVDENKYSPLIGVWKSIQNVAVTVGIPALAVLLNSYTEWMPEDWYPIAVPIMSIVSYFIKNFLKNKQKK